MSARNWIVGTLLAAYCFLWIGGVVAYTFLGGPPAHVAWTSWSFLFIAGLTVLATSDLRTFLSMLAAGGIGFVSEIIGVHIAIPFGSYFYTDALGPRVLDVPLVMIAAWFVLAAFGIQVTARLRWARFATAAAFAMLLTSIDLIIDPVAAGPLGYWVWRQPGAYYGIPATNFAGWFMVSFAIGMVIPAGVAVNRTHWLVGMTIALFFTLLALVFAIWLAAGAGIGVLLVCGAIGYRARSGYAASGVSSTLRIS